MNINLTKLGGTDIAFGNVYGSSEIDIEQVETEISETYDLVLGNHTGNEASQMTYGRYDIFKYVPSLIPLKTKIIPKCLELYNYNPDEFKIMAWFNVCGPGQGMDWHIHESTNHGYMVILSHGSKTRFVANSDFSLDNNRGQVVHLNGRYKHKVDPNPSVVNRISVAWNCFPNDYEEQARFVYHKLGI